MADRALRRIAKLIETFAMLIVFGMTLFTRATRLILAECLGVALVAAHLIMGAAQRKFGLLFVVEVLLFQRLECWRVTRIACGFIEQMAIVHSFMTPRIAARRRVGKRQIELGFGMAFRARHIFVRT